MAGMLDGVGGTWKRPDQLHSVGTRAEGCGGSACWESAPVSAFSSVKGDDASSHTQVHKSMVLGAEPGPNHPRKCQLVVTRLHSAKAGNHHWPPRV